MCPHLTVHAMQQHQSEEVTIRDRVPSQGGDSTALPNLVSHVKVAALAMTLSVVRTELKNGLTSQRQPGEHLSPSEICLERCWQLCLSYQSLALRSSPVRQFLHLDTAFSDTSAAVHERCRGLPKRFCQMDKEQQNAFKMERELCLGRTKLRKENRQDAIQRLPWLKTFSGSAR